MLFSSLLLLRFLFVVLVSIPSNWPRTAAANKTNCLVCLKKFNITYLRECKVFQIIRHLCRCRGTSRLYSVCRPLKTDSRCTGRQSLVKRFSCDQTLSKRSVSFILAVLRENLVFTHALKRRRLISNQHAQSDQLFRCSLPIYM